MSHLDALRNALLDLHGALAAHERVAFERVHGGIASPGAFLEHLLQHHDFAWLRPLSSLIASIDEAVDEGDTKAELALFRRASAVMSTDVAVNEHSHHYLGAVQQSPDAVLAYRTARQLIEARGTAPFVADA
jgi:hypothetical protein